MKFLVSLSLLFASKTNYYQSYLDNRKDKKTRNHLSLDFDDFNLKIWLALYTNLNFRFCAFYLHWPLHQPLLTRSDQLNRSEIEEKQIRDLLQEPLSRRLTADSTTSKTFILKYIFVVPQFLRCNTLFINIAYISFIIWRQDSNLLVTSCLP